MCRVEAYRCDIAKGSDMPAPPGRAKRVAAVFDEPDIVFLAKLGNSIQIENIPQGVSNHHCLNAGRVRHLELCDINLIPRYRHIQKYGDKIVLDDGVYRRRKSSGHGNHLVSRFQLPVTEAWRTQRA